MDNTILSNDSFRRILMTLEQNAVLKKNKLKLEKNTREHTCACI